ncbi:LytR/AlgR family response regulator transcription factor [Lacrimispora sp.]|jgi:two-component system response regulator LytT|uniref:LytR/AlgR family response regulator transcription factor n=1 Tax=Lacrimispora sp. TaxID=2719234 RepID=UPI0028AF5C28|nr:LytTR family DNA-binding domain-containing protein [Lacrimispora sp.]
MLTIFMCDDDPEARAQYARLIKKVAKKNKVEITISYFNSGEELLFYLADSPNQADIIYLDILMNNLNGLDTAKKLRELECNSEIIFLTTSEDYVFDAYDISPIHYLMKSNITTAKFEEVFIRATTLASKKENDMFLCESGKNNIRKVIPFKEISFFEIWKRIVTVHYNGGESFDFYSTMEQLENQLLHKGFIRIHRSYIVNMSYISQFQQNTLFLKTGENIPIGATYMKQMKQVFIDYISRTNIHDCG